MTARLYIRDEEEGLAGAFDFAETHVVISKCDIQRIGRLAKKLGFYEELKALGVVVHEIGVGEPVKRKAEAFGGTFLEQLQERPATRSRKR